MTETTRPGTPGPWRGGAVRLLRIGGVDFLVRPSLLLMAVVLVLVFTERFEGRTTSSPLVLSIGFVAGLYVSVLIHEVAHVVAARAFGARVRSVTLHLLGGETAIEGDSRTPRQELIVSGIGPVASLIIGLVCRGLDTASTGTTHDLLWTVGTVNLFVAAFNLIPGLPLDGGRVLRAIIWAATGNEALGIRVAAWIGRITAVVSVVVVVVLIIRSDDVSLLQLLIVVLLALFLWNGASSAVHNADRRTRVNRLEARAIARPGTVSFDAARLDARLHGSLLLREIAAHPAEQYAVTEADGTVVGVLTLDDLDDAYRATR